MRVREYTGNAKQTADACLRVMELALLTDQASVLLSVNDRPEVAHEASGNPL